MYTDGKGLQFNVQFEEKPEEAISYQVVVFDENQQPVYQSQVKEENFNIPFSGDDFKGKRIFLLPFNEERKSELSLERVESANSYEVTLPLRFDPSEIIKINPIPRYIWIWWPLCRCHVRGRVFNYCGDQYLPVAKARVHICDVDPIIWYIQKLPDVEVIRLRDEILAAAIDWHLPDPPIDKRIDTRVPLRKSSSKTSAIKSNIKPVQFKEFSAAEINQSSILSSSLPKENLSSFYSSSPYLVKNYIIQQYKFFYPYWCWIKSIFLRCDEVAVIETDTAGWFEGDIWYRCFGDKPDLYFWVEYMINGSWTTVYRPWIGCNTYWDYVCNTEVDIYLNDQRIPCPSWPTVPGNKVVVTTLGNNVNVNRVDQTASATQGLAPDLGYAVAAPFLGSVEPHVFFGSGLNAAGITYYRWRYKAHAELDVDTNWKTLTQSVDRYYFHESPDSFLSYNLGPKAYQADGITSLANANLFEIQTANVPAPGINTWYTLNARTDTATAYFNTTALNTLNTVTNLIEYADGLYDLKLEFFDATGTQVTLGGVTGTGTTIEVPDATIPAPFTPPLVGVVAAPADYQLLNSTGDLIGFKMTIRVDNHPTSAMIYETIVTAHNDGPPASVTVNTGGDCGMIEYANKTTDTAHISFQAFHQNDFAYFNFDIVKGTTGSIHSASGNVSNIPTATLNGALPIPAPINREYYYNPATDEFDADFMVNDLLGIYCNEAAFAETLNVYGTATDGWSRTGYDSGNVKAFALKH